MPEPKVPRSFGDVANLAAVSLIGNRSGRVLLALFVIFEIYTNAALPVWQQASTIRGALGKLQQLQAEARNATEQAAGRARGRTADAASKLAEANNAVAKAKADADNMGSQADLLESKANTETQLVQARIANLKNEAAEGVNRVLFDVGEPLPPTLSFDSGQ